jgi:phospholipase/carboxylesterase
MMRKTVLLFALVAAAAAAACQKLIVSDEAGVHFIQVFAQGADSTAPLLVWLHGSGGGPDGFESFWRKMPARMEIALPQGFIPDGDGYAWFDRKPGTSVEDFAKDIAGCEERVWRGVVAEAHGRKVLVGGFSQGAILAYALAARHPEIVSAFPIAGVLPSELFPPGHTAMAPVFAMHGTEDTVIPVEYGRRTVAGFRALGGQAELQEFPGAGHEITQGMRDALVEHVQAALPPPQ